MENINPEVTDNLQGTYGYPSVVKEVFHDGEWITNEEYLLIRQE